MHLKRRKAYNRPKQWSKSEEKKLLSFLKSQSFDLKKIKQLFPKRSSQSIRSKVRKLRIKHDLFGSSYRADKETFTKKIADLVTPKAVFDAYAGAGHQTFKWIEEAQKVYASEISKSKLIQFKRLARANGFSEKGLWKNEWIVFSKGRKKIYYMLGDAVTAAAHLKVNGVKIELIDLDTCGSTIPTLPTLLVLLRPKHIVITHGEFHSMRFKREDVLRRLFMHRNVSKNPLPLKVEEMSVELDKAVKIAALRAHNETCDSFWVDLENEIWLGGKFHGMLRRHYKVKKPMATADCINEISN